MKKGFSVLRFRRSVRKGSAVKVLFVIIHPMETGLRKSKKTGRKIPANYLTDIKVKLNGKLVADLDTKAAVSKNPTFAVYMKAAESGTVSIEYKDNKGGSWSKKRSITVS